jgi:hypothetical protein
MDEQTGVLIFFLRHSIYGGRNNGREHERLVIKQNI